MAKVVITPAVVSGLDSLLILLFEKGYFSFKENAIQYVDDLYNFILSIPSLRKRPTKSKKFGAWYCRFKPNKHTTWYVTFDVVADVYLIKRIINNHTRDYPAFIKGIS